VVLSFWITIGLVVIIPLIAIWRNLAAVGMIFAEEASRHTRLSAQVIEAALKVVSAVAMASWLARIVPTESLPRWAWLIVAIVLGGAVAVFSRRMIYWHSRWEDTLGDVFRSPAAGEGESPEGTTRPAPAWLATPGDWKINVQECVLPEGAACGGRTIADLRVRSRFGCSIMEIHRHGATLIAPEPSQVLYGGDRLLLLGTERLGRAGAHEERGVDREVVGVPVRARRGGRARGAPGEGGRDARGGGDHERARARGRRWRHQQQWEHPFRQPAAVGDAGARAWTGGCARGGGGFGHPSARWTQECSEGRVCEAGLGRDEER